MFKNTDKYLNANIDEMSALWKFFRPLGFVVYVNPETLFDYKALQTKNTFALTYNIRAINNLKYGYESFLCELYYNVL